MNRILGLYLAGEALLLVLLRFAPANGIWMLLVGFLAIGFAGALVFHKRPLESSKALIASTAIIFLLFWLYIFATLIFHALADPGLVPEGLRQALQSNAAGSLIGAVPDALGAMFTSWVICLLLAMAGNIFGVKVGRLVHPRPR
ncbi:MAG: hypothetical protein ACRDHX_09560 [Chloroflexota bacterium]